MSSVCGWLEGIGLDQYEDALDINDIDMAMLPEIDDQSLKDISIRTTGTCPRTRKAIEEFSDSSKDSRIRENEEDAPATPSVTEAERRQLTALFCGLVDPAALSQKLDPKVLRQPMHSYQSVSLGEGVIEDRVTLIAPAKERRNDIYENHN